MDQPSDSHRNRGSRWVAPLGAVVALAAAAGVVGWVVQDAPAGRIRLPDGTTYHVAPLGFDRPQTRQAAGLEKRWQEAGAAYESGEYAQSARLFGSIEQGESRDPERHDAVLYHGISLLMDGRHEEAGVVLGRARELARESGLSGSTDAFYAGVAALGRDDTESALDALTGAVGGPLDTDARRLIEALRVRHR